MKYIKKYKFLFLILLLSLLLPFTEFYILKGYFSNQALQSPISSGLIPISQNDPDSLLYYDYRVKYQNDSTLVFNLRNNGWGCQYIEHYRNNDLRPNVKEVIKETMPYLRRIVSKHKTHESKHRFECGTGLGLSTFCPMESVNTSITLKEIVSDRPNSFELFNWDSTYFKDIVRNQIVYDLVFGENITIIKWNTDYQCNPKDSIELQFHLPFYSAYDKKERKVYSNSIKISYCKLVDAFEETLKKRDFHSGNYKLEYISFAEEN